MQKTGKILLGLAAFGTAIGVGIAYLSKNKCNCDCCNDCSEDYEDDDFDLDDDLEPITDREYVPLGSVPTSDAAVADTKEFNSKETVDETTTVEKNSDSTIA